MKETPFLAGREDCLPNLRRMTAFADFGDEHLKTILTHSRIRKYDAGEVVLREGAVERMVYFLISGAVRVEKEGKKVGVLAEPGDVFGEMGLIDGGARSATVRAEEESMCLAVDGSFLDRLDEENRAACHSMLYRMFAHALAERLRATNEELVRARKALVRLVDEGRA
ncbi:MAG: cyclic nucleotide-binding domain-containing protein [Thermodesulfobacteriota bacterium]